MRTNKHSPSARRFGNALIIASLVITSCVTVNVNFPESAVQRAADDFVQDLYKGTTAVADADAKGTASDAAAMKKSMKKKSGKVPAAESVKKPTSFRLELFSSAYAVDIDARVKTDSPQALELKQKMRSRIESINVWKQKGVVCETMQGVLKLAAPTKAGGDAAKVAALVKQENSDREALYSEMTKANQGLREEVVRRNFATSFRAMSPEQGQCD